nr:ComEC/Rec2 family competence protein [Actinomycetota bacterium]
MQVAAAGPAERRAHRSLSDAGAVMLALATAGGAWWGLALPLALPAALLVLALVLRRPAVLVVGAALLAAALSARATDGLAPPEAMPFVGEVALAADPESVDGFVRAEARVGERRVEVSARGAAGDVVAEHLAGERVVVRGRLGPLPDAVRARLGRRHLSARLQVEEAVSGGDAPLLHRLANGLRRTLSSGAEPLGDARPLFLGMVVGDDRDQPAVVAHDFRAAGLTHLLAVSGQNVAFVIVLADPVLRRLGLRTRWVVTIALIAFFALLTRFEPSVLRASAMAVVACTAFGLGRPVSRLRILALAVTGVLLLDPFLVRSVGFLLSVGASTGIILLARPLAARLPGPRWSADLAGVTLAAQVGVAPVLVPVFGALPLASLPANLLAVPAAGPLMVWGLTAGMAAGALGSPSASWLHLPTRVLVG